MVNKWSGELHSLTRCFPFQCLATFNPKIRPLLDGAESNKNRWCELEKERQARQKEEEENKHQPITWHCWRTSFFYSSYSLPYRQMVGNNRNSIGIQSEFNRNSIGSSLKAVNCFKVSWGIRHWLVQWPRTAIFSFARCLILSPSRYQVTPKTW